MANQMSNQMSNQMVNQMAGMNLGAGMGGFPPTQTGMGGWGAPAAAATAGHTLSTNLWQ